MAPGPSSPCAPLPARAGRRDGFAPEAPAFPPFHRRARAAAAWALRRWCGLHVEGAEHLPASGPFILAANHHNYLDGVVLGVAVPRPIAFLVMPGVFHASPIHPGFHRRIGSIPVNLERPDPRAIKRALRVLDKG
ncbi:MAG: 1-acyl-sn-glycerol-3-phosphate acyltransferase, partial [Candidatus Rokubacteria bacterium]|nr:1-acyl-sn-glycerol-3-phosphate acyltransferase [Candidatus Rokubacteria bacterium]